MYWLSLPFVLVAVSFQSFLVQSMVLGAVRIGCGTTLSILRNFSYWGIRDLGELVQVGYESSLVRFLAGVLFVDSHNGRSVLLVLGETIRFDWNLRDK